VFTRREYVDRALRILCIAVLLVSAELIWRRFTVLAGISSRSLDLEFAHETPVLQDFVILLLISGFVWPSGNRRRWAFLLLPLLLYAQMVTERRSGWVCLDLGLLLIVAFIFRLRRKVFFFVVCPLAIAYCGYLVVAWNATGVFAQPARAVRSISSPDVRDASSNNYRKLETSNIRLNIQSHPVSGLGFGHEFTFYNPLPDLSSWSFWHYTPHNALLWLWMAMGPIGFITFLTLIGAGTMRGVHLLRGAANDGRAPLLVALASTLPMIAVYSYVDLGLTNARIAVLLGLVLGVIGTWGKEAAAARSVS
jgi:hypothetical protein